MIAIRYREGVLHWHNENGEIVACQKNCLVARRAQMYEVRYGGKLVSRHANIEDAKAAVLCYGDSIYENEDARYPILTGREVLRERKP